MGLSEEDGYLCLVGDCGYWFFLKRLVIYVGTGLVDLGLNWYGLYCSL